MLSEADFFWKNFRLGTELQISGTFIYNGLYAFDQMEHFYYEEQVFEFLYLTSVGLERLFKIVLVLLEHNDSSNQDEYEKSLITHNHIELLKRVKKHKNLNWHQHHVKFLQLLSDFYNSMRYNRFLKKSVYKPDQDKLQFISYLEAQLNVEIKTDMIGLTSNERRFKNFIGKIIGRISQDLYSIIRDQTSMLNIYTYEVTYNSKAFKIFIAKEYTFDKENLAQKEILIFLLNQSKRKDSFQKFIKTLFSLPLKSYHTHHYVAALFNIQKHTDVIDEIEYIYEENSFDKERFEAVNLIGQDFDFDPPENTFFDDFKI